MATFTEILPPDLRAHIEAAPLRPAPSAARYMAADAWDTARPQPAPCGAYRDAALAKALAWLHDALAGGEVIATGWPADAPATAPAVAIPPARWAALRFSFAKNAALARATGAVMFEGVAFERAAQKRPRGRPAAAGVSEMECIIAGLKRDGATPSRAEFRKSVGAGERVKFETADAAYAEHWPAQERKIRGENLRRKPAKKA